MTICNIFYYVYAHQCSVEPAIAGRLPAVPPRQGFTRAGDEALVPRCCDVGAISE